MIIKVNKTDFDNGQIINLDASGGMKIFIPFSLDGDYVYIYTAYEPQDILCSFTQVSKNDVRGRILTELEIPED